MINVLEKLIKFENIPFTLLETYEIFQFDSFYI